MGANNKGAKQRQTNGCQLKPLGKAQLPHAHHCQNQDGRQVLEHGCRSRVGCLDCHKIGKLAEGYAENGKCQQMNGIPLLPEHPQVIPAVKLKPGQHQYNTRKKKPHSHQPRGLDSLLFK